MLKAQKTDWKSEYQQKLVTAEEAAKVVKSGDWIDFGIGNSKPIDFVEALAARKDELQDVKFRSILTVPPVPAVAVADPQGDHFVWNTWHFGGFDRKRFGQAAVWFIPMVYHELPHLIREYVDIDVVCVQVTPINSDGYFNFGTSISHTKTICDKARTVVVEVNQNMPWPHGRGEELIHISEVDWIIEGSGQPLAAMPKSEPSDTDVKIAGHILEEVEDGSCIQLGIGGLAEYVGNSIARAGIRDLGIHTEFLTDATLAMYEAGCITGKHKAIDVGKIVYTFGVGSQELYDFMDDNPMLLGCSVEYTNNPWVISRNPKVVSVNNFLEVDLTGQVCSESAGTRHISGTGGQFDFVKGAFDSQGGKSFLCMASTYKMKDGNLGSRIKPTLTPGAIVTVPRSCSHYIVTEYGKACMKGKATWERAEALINIAHPDFRDELVKEAEKVHIWRQTNKIV